MKTYQHRLTEQLARAQHDARREYDDFLARAWDNARRDVERITPRQRRIFDNNDALRRRYGTP